MLLKHIVETSDLSGEEQITSTFFSTQPDIQKLARVNAFLQRNTYVSEQPIPGAVLLTPNGYNGEEKPALLLSQVHGNEPTGLYAQAFVYALHEADLLVKPVLLAVGNTYASQQYFDQFNATAAQPTRDKYRRGVAEDGTLFPDLNRFDTDRLELLLAGTEQPQNLYEKRMLELALLAPHVDAVIDVHSARVDLVMIETSSPDLLYQCPIPNVLHGMHDAISTNNNQDGMPLAEYFRRQGVKHTAIFETGTHEDTAGFILGAQTTLALLHELGYTTATPTESVVSYRHFDVGKKISFGDLEASAPIGSDEKIFPVIELTEASNHTEVLVEVDGTYKIQQRAEAINPQYAVHQFAELETVAPGQVVAVAESGAILTYQGKPTSGVFFTKDGRIFDQDPKVGPWPGSLETKFMYPLYLRE